MFEEAKEDLQYFADLCAEIAHTTYQNYNVTFNHSLHIWMS